MVRPKILLRNGTRAGGSWRRSKSSGDQRVVGRFRPHCMARYRLVGFCRCSSRPSGSRRHPARSRLLWPSSCARLKLMALDAVACIPCCGSRREKRPAVVRLDAQLLLQRGAQRCQTCQQHALAAVLDHLKHLHVDQRGEHDGLAALQFRVWLILAYTGGPCPRCPRAGARGAISVRTGPGMALPTSRQ